VVNILKANMKFTLSPFKEAGKNKEIRKNHLNIKVHAGNIKAILI
jgi:hypothetical protein